jgi:glutamate racemase
MKKAIGIFDSGIGGLTVTKEIIKQLPNENIVYLGDTARVPYGNKSSDTIKKFSLEIANFLLQKNIKLLVIACNTASSFALSYLKQKINIPIIGVIEPGASAAAKITKNKKIGIIGTKGTINSQSYQNTLKKIDSSFQIFEKDCPLFVPLVEEGWIQKEVSYMIADEYLKNLKKHKIDTLILGCTHYPILKNVISTIMGNDVNIIDSAIETAKKVKEILEQKLLLANDSPSNSTNYEFYVSDDSEKFKEFAIKILDQNVKKVEKISLHQ